MKKTQIGDIYYMMIYLFLLAFVLLISWTFINQLDQVTDPELNQTIMDYTTTAVEILDYAFPMMIIFSFFWGLASGYLLNTRLIYFFLFILLIIVGIYTAGLLSNLFFEAVAESTYLTTALANFPLMDLVWTNMPLIVLIYGCGMAVGTYARGTI